MTEGPGEPDEEREGGFEHSGCRMRNLPADADAAARIGALVARARTA